jgi:hypothetical protein
MTYYSTFCENPTPPSSHRAKRHIDVLTRLAVATSAKNGPLGVFA